MSKLTICSSVMLVLVAVGCSSTGGSGPSLVDAGASKDGSENKPVDGGAEMSLDATSAVDAPFVFDANFQPPDGSVMVGCETQASCAGMAGNSVCCGTLQLSGTFPSCSFGSLVSSCTSSCTTNTPLACSTYTVKPCSATADCSDQGSNNSCCTFSMGGTSLAFCFSAGLAAIGGGQCM